MLLRKREIKHRVDLVLNKERELLTGDAKRSQSIYCIFFAPALTDNKSDHQAAHYVTINDEG